MIINAEKSGIMSILNRKGKIKGATNKLNIHEVSSYCYQGIKKTQTLKLDPHINIRLQSKMLIKKVIRMFKPSLINTKRRLIHLLKFIKSKFIENLK